MPRKQNPVPGSRRLVNDRRQLKTSPLEAAESAWPTLPRGKGHHAEWIEACKRRGETFSSFHIGGPMTELIQLGNAAVSAGEPVEYDTLSGKIVNLPDANRFLHRDYRPGWKL